MEGPGEAGCRVPEREDLSRQAARPSSKMHHRIWYLQRRRQRKKNKFKGLHV